MVNTQTQTRPAYFLWQHRLIINLLLSHCLVALTQPKSTFQVMQQLNYYVAMLFSVSLGSLLFWVLQDMTKYLDKHYPWDEAFMARLWWQVMAGVCGVMLLELLMVAVYLEFFNTSLSVSGFMENEFWTVLFVTGLANAVYSCWYFYERYVKKPVSYPVALNGKLGNKVYWIPIAEIICIQRKRDIGYIYTRAERYTIAYRKEELDEMLDPKKFIRISRSVIFQVDVIAGYRTEAGGISSLILKPGITVEVSLKGTRSGSKRIRERFKEVEG